ncbi:MAG: FAD-dependent oxidoreductase, partial [Actinomycetota bacterium]|nr:FAD-dependent oxidoreductase [Actinomycetota bacterium]
MTPTTSDTAGRQRNVDRLVSETLDVLVVGGGINGAVSALALSSAGLKVGLVERHDFASGTSQESSNMVWGGFKYLESYEVRLVAELCRSRNRLARAYPTRLVESRFLAALGPRTPHPPWFATLGANTYWALGQFATRRPRYRAPSTIRRLEPAVDTSQVSGGIEYSDYLLPGNDARFVSELALGAIGHGAAVSNRVELEAAEKSRASWLLGLRDTLSGERFETEVALLVNTAGPEVPWVGEMTGTRTKNRLVYSKGVHLVVPQITDSGRTLAFFDDAERLFYVLPMAHRSVIGTTDTRVTDPNVEVTEQDRTFLLEQANSRLELAQPITLTDVIAERCGVRSLVVPPGGASEGREWTELSRRHAVEVDERNNVISVLGGKLSDCLNVGEEVIDGARRCGLRPMTPARPWYGEPDSSERAKFDDVARVA